MRRCRTLRICLNQTLVAVLPATAPVGLGNRSVKNPFRKETLESHGANEIAKNRPATGGAVESRRREGHNRKIKLWQRHHWQTSSSRRSLRIRPATDGGEIRPVSIRHRRARRRSMTTAPSQGGTQVNMPHWNDLTGNRQPLSDSASAGGQQNRG